MSLANGVFARWRFSAVRLDRVKLLVRGGFGRWLGATILFSVATVVHTWPLVLHATDSIVDLPAPPDESYGALWSLWWIKHSLLALDNPFHTDLLFYPGGTDLYGLPFLNGVLSIPLQLATNNLILSWNLLALPFFVFSALGMYALSYRVNRSHAAALISGYIFAFAPFFLMRFAGQWSLSTSWPIPLFALFLIRFQDTGRIRDAAGAAVFWALLTYNSPEYAAFSGLFLGLFLAYWSLVYLRQRDLARLVALGRGIAVTVIVWLTATAPVIIASFLTTRGADIALPQNDEFYSSDLLALVTPSRLWGPGSAIPLCCAGVQHVPAGSLENTVYLGILPLLLAGVALLAIRRTPHRVVFWALVFLSFATLAMGPFLYIGDTKTFSLLGASFSIPLPYQLYDQLPVVGLARAPVRMISFGIVALAVLAGTGFDFLTSWLRPKYKMIVPLAALLVLSLVVLEYWNPPTHLTQFERPVVFEEIRDEPGDFAVLHAPWGRNTGAATGGHGKGAVLTNYYQTIHERPTFGGSVGRARAEDFYFHDLATAPGLGYFARISGEQFPEDLDSDEVRRVFRELRIKYVVLHRLTPKGAGMDIPPEGFEIYDVYLRTVPGLVPIYTDSTLTVYRNPELF